LVIEKERKLWATTLTTQPN